MLGGAEGAEKFEGALLTDQPVCLRQISPSSFMRVKDHIWKVVGSIDLQMLCRRVLGILTDGMFACDKHCLHPRRRWWKGKSRERGWKKEGRMLDGIVHGMEATPFDRWYVCLWQTLPPSLTRTNKDLEGIFCVKVCGRRVDWRMRERRVLGGAGFGTIGRHVASASTPIPYHSGQHSGSCHHFDGSHVCRHTNPPPPPLLATHTVGDIWWQSQPPLILYALSILHSHWCCEWHLIWMICPSLFLQALYSYWCWLADMPISILISAIPIPSLQPPISDHQWGPECRQFGEATGYWHPEIPISIHPITVICCSAEKQLVQRWDFSYNIKVTWEDAVGDVGIWAAISGGFDQPVPTEILSRATQMVL